MLIPEPPTKARERASSRTETADDHPVADGRPAIAPTVDVDLRRLNYLERLLFALGARAEELEDLVQDVLLKFYARGYCDEVLDVGREKALLAKMGYSTYIDRFRRNRLRGSAPLVDLPEARDAERESLVSWVRELTRLAALDRDDFLLLNQRFDLGLTFEAIASLRCCHVNTVRRRLDDLIERLGRAARRDDAVDGGMIR